MNFVVAFVMYKRYVIRIQRDLCETVVLLGERLSVVPDTVIFARNRFAAVFAYQLTVCVYTFEPQRLHEVDPRGRTIEIS